MAYEFYMKVKFKKQGAMKGESPREEHKEKVPCLGFYYDLKSPRDAASGLASGKRTHGPIKIVKEWGASSPQFFQALCTNEVLEEVMFEFIRTTPEGAEEVHHTIRLVNASVSELEQYIEGNVKQDQQHDVHELEKISFTFQRIEMESKRGKTMATDDWFAKASG